MEICHVCKKEKKPYTLFIKNDIFSIIHYQEARAEGPICEKCDSYSAMTGEYKEPTEEEYKIAKKAAWFANMVKHFWEKDEKLVTPPEEGLDVRKDKNQRTWEGTAMIASWCRKYLNSTKR